MTYTYYNEELGIDVELDIEYSYNEYVSENRKGDPDNWYPAEGGDIDNITIIDENGVDITNTISKELFETIEKACYKDINKF